MAGLFVLMKSICTSLVLALGLSATAQNTFRLENFDDNAKVISPNSAIYVTAQADPTHSINIDIINTSNSTQSYHVKRYDIVLNASSTETAAAFFCFAGGCFTPFLLESPDPLTLSAGARSSEVPGDFQMLLAEIDEIDPAGFSHVKYTVYNEANPQDSIQFSIRYNDPFAGLGGNHLYKNGFSIAPNPAQRYASAFVNLSRNEDCSINIYNSLGARVGGNDLPLSAGVNTVPLNIESLTKGLYFVTIKAGDYNSMRRLIIH